MKIIKWQLLILLIAILLFLPRPKHDICGHGIEINLKIITMECYFNNNSYNCVVYYKTKFIFKTLFVLSLGSDSEEPHYYAPR